MKVMVFLLLSSVTISCAKYTLLQVVQCQIVLCIELEDMIKIGWIVIRMITMKK